MPRSDEPQLRWIGCVEMPDGDAGEQRRDVFGRHGAGFGADAARNVDHGFRARRMRPAACTNGGRARGRFVCCRARGCPGTTASRLRADDREFYVVAFGWHAVVVYSRDDTSQPLRKAIAPGFMPDNIHWDGSRLILAGMQYDEPACGGTRKIIDGKADDMRCHRGYTVAALDPQTLEFTIVAYAQPNAGVQRRLRGAHRRQRAVARRVPGRPYRRPSLAGHVPAAPSDRRAARLQPGGGTEYCMHTLVRT